MGRLGSSCSELWCHRRPNLEQLYRLICFHCEDYCQIIVIINSEMNALWDRFQPTCATFACFLPILSASSYVRSIIRKAIIHIPDSSVPKRALSARFSCPLILRNPIAAVLPRHVHRRQQMVCGAVIYCCIAGGALLFHKYFFRWIIDRILSAGSMRFHSLSMEWKIWCKSYFKVVPFVVDGVFFFNLIAVA